MSPLRRIVRKNVRFTCCVAIDHTPGLPKTLPKCSCVPTVKNEIADRPFKRDGPPIAVKA